MVLIEVKAASGVTAHNLEGLLFAWRLYGDTRLVKTFRCKAALSAAQVRRLPKGLREALRTE